jgi:hypothetical protein
LAGVIDIGLVGSTAITIKLATRLGLDEGGMLSDEGIPCTGFPRAASGNLPRLFQSYPKSAHTPLTLPTGKWVSRRVGKKKPREGPGLDGVATV